MRFRPVFFILLALFCSYLLAEMAALVFLWLATGQLPNEYESLILSKKGAVGNVDFAYDWNLHPYLGFRNPSRMFDLERIQVNNKPRDEFWVGVFGGSVAESLVGDSAVQAYLEAELVKFPTVANRRVRLLHLAHGGYKQPQQLITYALYGEKIDLVINLEGVNEISDFMLGHHFPFDFPVTAFRYFYQDHPGQVYLKASQLLVEVVHRGYWAYLYSRLLQLSPLATLTIYSLASLAEPLHQKLQWKFVEAYRRQFLLHQPFGSDEVFNQLFEIWRRNLNSYLLLARGRQTPVFVFLQPNQYIENSKPFSNWEVVNALSPNFRALGLFYSKFLEQASDLTKRGLPVYDLSQVFKLTNETVYKDACCHLNDLGNRIVAEAMVRQILNSDISK